ncbi:hypothetical protein QTP86_010828 [Hemibagrus guttatus]|nr:hypothetical protein QTP86_010828 [Hemibagrus guttatus]
MVDMGVEWDEISPLLFTLLTHDCTPKYDTNLFVKFADDTPVVGIITNNDENNYRAEVNRLAMWCSDNNLSLNVEETREIIIHFRRAHTQHPLLTNNSAAVERVYTTKFPGVHITLCTGPLLDQQHPSTGKENLYFLHKLRRSRSMETSYRGTIEGILSSCITAWFGNCSTADRKTQQCIVKAAGKIIGAPLASLLDIYNTCLAHKTCSIVADFMAGVVSFSGWRTVEDGKSLSENEQPESGRVYTMFHGTHIDNAENIISNGFKQSASGLLGKGVYVSRNIDKAKCYPLQTDKNNKVVFKLKVNVGKVKKIDVDNHPLRTTWHNDGYDCAWVPPNSNIKAIKSGREEDCVWDPKRITVVDVACCVDDGKRHKLRKLIHSIVRSNECPSCRQSSPKLPHELRDCWECGERICPFKKEHVCKGHRDSYESLRAEMLCAGEGQMWKWISHNGFC